MGALVWKGAKGGHTSRGREGHNGHCLTLSTNTWRRAPWDTHMLMVWELGHSWDHTRMSPDHMGCVGEFRCVHYGEHSRRKATRSVWEGRPSLSIRMGDSESSNRRRPGAEYRLRGTESSLGSGRRCHKAELHVRNVDSVLWVVAK